MADSDPKPNSSISLPEVFRSVGVPEGNGLRKLLAFVGPGFLVSVGYMDPGNWATDLAGGSKFGYALLWVILASNLIAQLLQTMCLRMGLVTGMDLAMACRATYKRPAAFVLWILAEIAIIATDLAEVIGSAVALQLLFNIPLEYGVIITALDVLLLLGLMRFGFRKIEAIILTMVLTIGGCFWYQLALAGPNWGAAAKGTFIPTMPNNEALFIALGILGATVMPHNLYLHSAIVQTRKQGDSPAELKQAIKFNTIDTVVALSAAFFVNAAILVLAAAVFFPQGIKVDELEQGHELLKGALGGAAATAFAVALLASGQSSTVTATLAGQVVMEGFLQIRVKPWVRRLITRLLAIIPALILVKTFGGAKTVEMLVLSQVVLTLQLPFAILPLVAITSNRKKMGEFVNPMWMMVAGFACAFIISGLSLYFLFLQAREHNVVPWYFGLISVAVVFGLWVQFIYKEKPKAA
jgi:manganese transport protein